MTTKWQSGSRGTSIKLKSSCIAIQRQSSGNGDEIEWQLNAKPMAIRNPSTGNYELDNNE